MKENKKDFLILKTGWNEAVREVLNILDKKYSKYKNMYSVKQDIKKLLDAYGKYEKLDFPCEIYKYYPYGNVDYGHIILSCIDKIEGYCLNIKERTYLEMSETDCLFSINNLTANSIQEFENEEKAREELNKILSNFKKAED